MGLVGYTINRIPLVTSKQLSLVINGHINLYKITYLKLSELRMASIYVFVVISKELSDVNVI